MKRLILIFLLLFFGLQVNSQIIMGEVQYNQISARDELLNTNIPTLSNNELISNLYDGDFQNNQNYLISGQTELKDRTLAKFSDGSYGIIYKNNPLHVWYYSKIGNLTHYEIKTSLNFPYKAYKYSVDKKLVNMSLRPSENETFIYTKEGKLIAHWLGENCYDSLGNLILKRKLYE